ncbi:MAG: cyanoexosortase B system-associated protein [Cyanothece sp. SIO2G6]|nr:cyanoexosortase B system-associated protein [Cyanothece sp. SIO2G6]
MNKLIQANIHKKMLPMLGAVVVLAIACAAIAPNYVTGNWVWSQEMLLPETRNLRAIQQAGLELPGWITVEQHTDKISHQQWSFQSLTPTLDADSLSTQGISPEQLEVLQQAPLSLFLRPQSYVDDEPLVEWIDLNSFFNRFKNWTVDELHTVQFSASGPEQEAWVSARYFRGWQRIQNEQGRRTTYTYAVMQWYAWPTGGSTDIAGWFWADQERQWRDRQRMPWVAVTLMIPIKPLGDIALTQPLAEAIAQTVQTTLTTQLLAPPASN